MHEKLSQLVFCPHYNAIDPLSDENQEPGYTIHSENNMYNKRNNYSSQTSVRPNEVNCALPVA
jgi:hypothetical protein